MASDSSYGQVVHLPGRGGKTAPRARGSLGPAPSGTASGTMPDLVPDTLTDLLLSAAFDPAATGFLIPMLPASGAPVLWAQDLPSARENGQVYMPGLRGLGLDRPVLRVTVNTPRDVLWAMEEGVSCAGLSAVIGEIHGAPQVLDFTATKRLAIRAEASGVPAFLIRSADPGVLSAARARWRIRSLPSGAHPHDPHAPGAPRWDAELFRARGRPPGRWSARYEPATNRPADRLHLVPRTGGGALAAGEQPPAQSAKG